MDLDDLAAAQTTFSELLAQLSPDAWFAALAVESGCDWVTTDRDYARFPGLKWHAPS